ncbi:N-methyl-L-tryptophan oxidase [Aquincola sp. S2]|uniref:N-methyl-L-tryptophan oxidase n=1 Tax=Pseudaquabacterium terrae TaxID=2732868 RepID=A0ABX2E9T3_9BURK|nr:N-methyl-L-tryptophan oxidase [Aquabacterium terrae]NRF65779.1 N-methyl-L-tryptophan oxidase [Aquabacterium terrae]
MNPPTVADVIVIGLGAFGSATAWQLARRGARVIGIDRFAPPHDRGSSHGATRITRLAIGEGELYVPIVLRSHQIWQALEAAHGERLYLKTGGLTMGAGVGQAHHHRRPDFLRRTIAAARRFDIPHEVLNAAEVAARFAQFLVRGDEVAYYEPDAGVLKPERCVAVQLEAARRAGAVLRLNETVLAIESAPGGAAVRTDRGSVAAGHVIVTAGPWLPGLVGGAYAAQLRVMRQALHWFRPAEPALYASPGCPVFIWMHGSGDGDTFYGFPMVDGFGGVKVATEQYRQTTDPDHLVREVGAEESADMHARHVAGRLRSVTPERVHAAACPYTVSPDSGFVVDRHPTLDHVTVVSACSGHGFKHSAGLGEALAQATLGEVPFIDLGALSLRGP